MPNEKIHPRILAIRKRRAQAEQKRLEEAERKKATIKRQIAEAKEMQEGLKEQENRIRARKRKQKMLEQENERKFEREIEEANRIINSLVNQHKETLLLKFRQCHKQDDYGQLLLSEEAKWHSEIEYFVYKVIGNKIDHAVIEKLNPTIIAEQINHAIKVAHANYIQPEDVTSIMQGMMYEIHCAGILRNHGWTTKLTKGSGDQGVDILAKKNDVIVALQCKKYAKPVGNKAVQEAFTGMQYSRANFAAVVTNAGYTKAAQDAARNTGTFLLQDMDLPQLEALITTKSLRAV